MEPDDAADRLRTENPFRSRSPGRARSAAARWLGPDTDQRSGGAHLPAALPRYNQAAGDPLRQHGGADGRGKLPVPAWRSGRHPGRRRACSAGRTERLPVLLERAATMSERRVTIRVEGMVQGVNYRQAARREAERLG